METTRPFSPELLTESPEARLAYFKSKIILHPKLKAVHTRLIRAIQHRPAQLVLICGPTGVGKTTLRLRVEDEVTRTYNPNGLPDSIPIAGVSAASGSRGGFEWKDFFISSLTQLCEPLISHKTLPPGSQSDKTGNFYLPGFEPSTRAVTIGVAERTKSVLALRLAFEQALKYRQTQTFIIDEAQHLKQIASGRRLLDQMDNVKTLANNTGIVYVLIGTYELLDLTNLSGQLSRRSLDLHFGRYRADNAQELEQFENILYSFQEHLPLANPPELVSHLEECYELTAGYVGILKDWLTDALAEALANGQESLSWPELLSYAPEERKRYAIALEASAGERRLAGSAEGTHQAEIRRLLGMPQIKPNQIAQAQTSSASLSSTSASIPQRAASGDDTLTIVSKRAKSQRVRVGERKPVRDKVGKGK